MPPSEFLPDIEGDVTTQTGQGLAGGENLKQLVGFILNNNL